MKKHIFWLLLVLLIVVFIVVSFYMFYVHIPYYQYYHTLDETRNKICETNHYEYMDYCYQYNGKEPYYILKVKINGVESYVAYDQELNLVDTYQGEVISEDFVKRAIEEKYQVEMNRLDIGYENDQFVYYGKYQTKEGITYIYYQIDDGDFLKAVKLGE